MDVHCLKPMDKSSILDANKSKLFVSVEENTMKEKKTPYDMLFQAKNIEGVLSKVKELMKGTMADYESIKIQETAILDFIPYK